MALPVSVHMGDFSNEIMQYMRVNLLGEDISIFSEKIDFHHKDIKNIKS
jgi:hypothetical protein